MARLLYDLAGAEDARRFSPYCWRVKMALAHKGLSFETRPWRFTEKDAIAFSGQGLVPVLVDGDRVLSDSWAICQYLEATYPSPPLADSPQAWSYALFIRLWTERRLQVAINSIIVLDIWKQLGPKDREYFRTTREARFGMTLEAFSADRAGHLANLRKVLDPLRTTLATEPFLGGAPSLADYVVFGAFQWARSTSPIPLLEPTDPIHAWRERMLALFDGLAANAPGYSVPNAEDSP